ncbi:outer membrane autotransporter protein [Paenochrobactrum gallinarii]|uniref:Outer membrane autotransporter protein n=1 Tax=Paenochrobactrum gallinarii TaxID=643673 RepID=A0A841M8P6_9HYPH|nr:autotransporter domain-containing protein [Paenochrobactrum gallinarii]MBB6261924.1 outer membrane autotransporter protein [Paenochrobactrum gallinarii]
MTSRLIAVLTMSTCLTTGLLFGAMVNPAAAITPYQVHDNQGNSFITLRFFDVGDGFFADGTDAAWNLNDLYKKQIIDATQYWAEIIKLVPGKSPAILNVGAVNGVFAAAASSPNASQMDGSPTTVQAALTNQYYTNLKYGAHGFIMVANKVGTKDWAQTPYAPSHITLTDETSLSTVTIHEIGHALGIASNAMIIGSYNSYPIAQFVGGFDRWSAHLRDDNDNPAKSGQFIYCNGCAVPSVEDAFDVRMDQAYFTGAHVSEVMNGAMKGLPMRIGTDYGSYDAPFFSHIELKNGLMSHQFYRNYNTLMEAEMAALQDIGYTIDRRNFYGHSVYGNGQTIINDNPYFARNADGTDYIANSYNTATLGLGLHVYGSHNNITQSADLLTAGAGGGGIRVDGEGNNLIIAPDVLVYADGANGRGIMFAYGKDHTLTHRGDVQALGENGIAVSFDFGHNARGDGTGYRGSYILDIEPSLSDKYNAIYQELNGALVSSFDVTGRVAGQKAAIFMSENAYVEEINIMQGAGIFGDVISDYEKFDDNHNLRLTKLRFGLEADAQGRATHKSDDDFTISYADNIAGSNISLQMLGGTSVLTGDHDLYDVTVGVGATLAGRGEYTIAQGRGFSNQGTLYTSLVGDAITVNGNYYQTEDGKLQLAFNDKNTISSLIINGDADIDGAIAFAPDRGFYHDGFSLTSDKWLQASAINGGFTEVSTALSSPTLSASVTDNGQLSYTITLNRQDGAYSRYADNKNGYGVGLAIDAAAHQGISGLHDLMTALDFSAADGSAIRAALPQLSGEAYASAIGVLANSGAATRASVNSRLQQAFGGTPAADVAVLNYVPVSKTVASASAIHAIAPETVSQSHFTNTAAWASAFGNWSRQSGNSNAARTTSSLGGFTTGIDTGVYEHWRLGVLAGYSHSSFKVRKRSASGSSDNYTLGAYAGAEWAVSGGALGVRSGLAYSWHNVDMSRSIAFAGFNDKLSADYNAGTFQLFGEVGYKLNVSQSSIVEPYVNLAYMRVHTDGFDEKGTHGAALAVRSGSLNSTQSTIGIRVATDLTVGDISALARADLGWRHAYGDVMPSITASFVGGSNAFTSLGSSVGRDTALIEAGFDLKLRPNTLLGLTYQGQFGSGVKQNGVNANLSVKF